MNNTSFAVGVVLDGKSVGVVKAAAEAKKAIDDMIGAGVKGSKESTQAYRAAAAAGRSEFTRMAQAREMLGIRSERRIQQEIRATEAAYKRLAASGTMSWDEQRRAAARTREEVLRLNNEMGRFSTRQRALGLIKGAGVGIAAVGAGAAVLAPRMQKAMSYDLRLAHMTNTAFNERDATGRKAGKAELDAMVSDAVRYGGGSRDDAASTLNTLLSAGAFNPKEAAIIFREAVMAGTANDADGSSFANIAVKASKSMGIAPERIGAVFGMGTYAGQQGQFEIRDMAKHLPRQMGSATQLGLYGEKGFAKLAAVNQAAMNTAGTADEAGINVANLVAKMSSDDTRKQFQKQLGIDLKKQIAEGRMRGVDAFDIVGDILEKQLSKDKNYRSVQKQLKTAAPGSEREAALNAVGNIAQGTVVGKVFSDQQALMALVAYMQDRKRVNEIAAGALVNTDATQRNMATIRDTPSFSAQSFANGVDIANQTVMNSLTPAMKYLTDKTVGLMEKYPGYTTAIVGTTTALTALAAAAGAAALGSVLLNGRLPGKGGSGIPGSPTSVGRSGGMLGRLLGGAAALGGPLMLLEALTGPSEADIAKLYEMDRRNSGYRGKGFTDPRILGSTPTLSERLGGAPGQPYMPIDPLRGEILVRITSAPGLTVEAEAKSNNPRIPMRAALGETNGEMRR